MRETIILGGGCFWCIEAAMQIVPGVIRVVPGYTGGKRPNPSYETVCTGMSGHAEVVQVEFDPAQIALERLLELFFKVHDPTQLNQQGNDVGTQYRSAIFWTNESQVPIITATIKNEQSHWKEPIVTEVEPLNEFYGAEEYHHNYFKKNPDQAYCQLIVRPKVEKVKASL